MARSQEFSVFIRNFPSRAVRARKNLGGSPVAERARGRNNGRKRTKTRPPQEPGEKCFRSCPAAQPRRQEAGRAIPPLKTGEKMRPRPRLCPSVKNLEATEGQLVIGARSGGRRAGGRGARSLLARREKRDPEGKPGTIVIEQAREEYRGGKSIVDSTALSSTL